MANLPVSAVTLAGAVVPSTAAAGGGDSCFPGDTTFVRVANGGGSDITVTFDSVAPSNYGTDADVAVTVTAGTTKLIGPFHAQRFASTSDGLVHWTYSGTTSVTVGAFSI